MPRARSSVSFVSTRGGSKRERTPAKRHSAVARGGAQRPEAAAREAVVGLHDGVADGVLVRAEVEHDLRRALGDAHLAAVGAGDARLRALEHGVEGRELELAKLYQIQNMYDEYISRLNSILEDFPRTKESAESSFLLGETTLLKLRDFDNALKYYAMVRSESRVSLFIKSAQLRIKEINAYSKLKTEYALWINNSPVDSTSKSVKNSKKINTTPKMLYGIAELEALHFNNSDSAMIYLDKLINLENNKEMMAKALYMKSFILDKSQKYKESKILKNQLIANFPQSDYAFAVLSSDSTLTTSTKSSNDMTNGLFIRLSPPGVSTFVNTVINLSDP